MLTSSLSFPCLYERLNRDCPSTQSRMPAAFFDRLVRNADRIELSAESMRKRQIIPQGVATGLSPSSEITVTA